MLQHTFFSQAFLELRCVLLDDAGKRDDDNHPAEPLVIRDARLGVVMRDVLEGERERTERLAAASRRREREQARRLRILSDLIKEGSI